MTNTIKKNKFPLAYQILIALILGCIVGAVFYGNKAVGTYLQPIADVFIRLIKMIVVPIVFCSLIVGIDGSEDEESKHIGRLGAKTIFYFEVVSLIAIILGIIVGVIFQPGSGVDMSLLSKGSLTTLQSSVKKLGDSGLISTFVNIVPTNIIDALAKGDLIAIIFFAVMFALGLNHIPQSGREVVIKFTSGVSTAMFWVTNQVMKVAPYGVFATMAVTVSKFGVKSLVPLGKLTLCTYGLVIVFGIGVHGLIGKMYGVNIFDFFRIMKEEFILAFSTASSETVLPKLMEKSEKFGCPKAITTFVIPIGYTFNLVGGMIYEGLAILFIAQMYHIHLSIADLVKLALILMITSKGAAGIPGGAFIIIIATLQPMGIPVEGTAFILGIDRLLDMGRTWVNVVGHSLAVVLMSKWEGVYDAEKGKKYLESIKAKEIVA
jgi:proton glutamate symport protein